MNKKGEFVAFLSLFVVLALVAVYFYLDKNTTEVVRIFYTSSDVLNQNFEIKEYLFNLNQNVKYTSFKAFNSLCENAGLYKKCDAWDRENCNPLKELKENYKKYFSDNFKEPFFEVSVEEKNNRFIIKGKYKDKMIFGQFNAKTEIIPEFEYKLDYGISIFSNLYNNCMSVISCDKEELKKKNCNIDKCDDSSDIKYIKMEFNLEDNGFIKPKIAFNIPKSQKLEG